MTDNFIPIGFIILLVSGSLMLSYKFITSRFLFWPVKNWRDYEKYCASVLSKTWFKKVRLGKGIKDGGIDIVAYKNGQKRVVQCKWYKSNIGLAHVQRHYGVAKSSAAKACFMTSTGFTKEARKFAKGRMTLKIV